MTEYQIRRVVTGHNPEGASTVMYDSRIPLLDAGSPGSGPRQEDRPGNASRVLWVTHGFPADNNDNEADAADWPVGTSEDDGTVLRIVRYEPGVAARRHRTNSIDYAIIISGSLQVELDTQTVDLHAGDVLVQRGTIHNWANTSSQPCVVAFVLIGARPVTIAGRTLPPQG